MKFDLDFLSKEKEIFLLNSNDIREILIHLITGDYHRKDIYGAVHHFADIGKSIIIRMRHFSSLIADWADFQIELDDVVLDYIAPLFARDEKGIFVELEKYFDFESELDINDQIYRLIHSILNQESIRTYEHRDPLGKVCYRSLRYILTKHPKWRKERNEHGELIIVSDDSSFADSTSERIAQLLKFNVDGSTSLVKALEFCLIKLLDTEKINVVVTELLAMVRMKLSLGDDKPIHQDPSLGMTVDIHITKTVKQIDSEILQRYESSKKLLPVERKGFNNALKKLLKDFKQDFSDGSYYTYLAAELADLDSEEVYKEKYRTQFEYVAKVAKQSFSASIKTDFKI